METLLRNCIWCGEICFGLGAPPDGILWFDCGPFPYYDDDGKECFEYRLHEHVCPVLGWIRLTPDPLSN